MSINLNVEATITTVHETLGGFEVRHTFDLWQTPTSVTRSILQNETIEEVVGAYAQWCFERNSEFAQDHLNALNHWLADHSAWDIEFYEM